MLGSVPVMYNQPPYQPGQPQHPQYPPQSYPPAPYAPRPGMDRSSIPKVVGILAIIFSVIGLLGALVQTFGIYGQLDEKHIPSSALGSFATWNIINMVLAAGVFGIHLAAGILSVRYSPRAPKFITIYGIFALALLVANIALTAALFPDLVSLTLDNPEYARYGLEVLALPWPIVALALMNTRRARQACADPTQRALAEGVFD